MREGERGRVCYSHSWLVSRRGVGSSAGSGSFAVAQASGVRGEVADRRAELGRDASRASSRVPALERSADADAELGRSDCAVLGRSDRAELGRSGSRRAAYLREKYALNNSRELELAYVRGLRDFAIRGIRVRSRVLLGVGQALCAEDEALGRLHVAQRVLDDRHLVLRSARVVLLESVEFLDEFRLHAVHVADELLELPVRVVRALFRFILIKRYKRGLCFSLLIQRADRARRPVSLSLSLERERGREKEREREGAS